MLKYIHTNVPFTIKITFAFRHIYIIIFHNAETLQHFPHHQSRQRIKELEKAEEDRGHCLE